MFGESGVREQDRLARTIRKMTPQESGPYFGTIIGQFLSLPRLRAFWPISSVDSVGGIRDISGNDLHLTLTGGISFSVTNNGVPYAQYNGTSIYHQRADENNLDVTSGFTLGGWFYISTLPVATNAVALQAKRGGAGTIQYGNTVRALSSPAGVWHRAWISSDGSAVTDVYSTEEVAESTWSFLLVRYTPSTELAVFTNGVKTVNTTSIPASIVNSTGAFQMCGYNGTTELFAGRAALGFLCGTYVADAVLARLYKMSRVLFGV